MFPVSLTACILSQVEEKHVTKQCNSKLSVITTAGKKMLFAHFFAKLSFLGVFLVLQMSAQYEHTDAVYFVNLDLCFVFF